MRKMKVYEKGDVVVYGADGLCRIEEITEKKFGNDKIKYYVLKHINGDKSVTYVPVGNERSCEKMRPVLTKEEVIELIESMPELDTMWINNDRDRQKEFKDIILFGDSRDLIKLIRSIYFHKKQQVKMGKKLHIADERVFKNAEKILYEEIGYVFGIDPSEALDLILKRIPKNRDAR